MPQPTMPPPRWATDPGADITEPSSGKKDTGHIADEVAAHAESNWWKNAAYLWQTHFRSMMHAQLGSFVTQRLGAPEAETLRAILAGVGPGSTERVVAVGDTDGSDAAIYQSVDGQLWSAEISNPNNVDLLALAHDATATNRWVAVGAAAATQIISTSDPGGTWTDRTVPGDLTDLFCAASNGSGLYVVGGSATTKMNAVASSTDGASWVIRTLGGTAPGGGSVVRVNDALFANGIFVAVGGDSSPETPRIWTSSDAVTWTERTAQGTEEARRIAWNGRVFLVRGRTEVQTSEDGITWTSQTALGASGVDAIGLAADPSSGVIAAWISSLLMYSIDDGVTFTPLGGLPVADNPTGVVSAIPRMAFGNGRFFAAGSLGHVARTSRR